MPVLPRAKTPDLVVETVDRGTWNLADQQPERLTLVVFYRGHH